jgi:hypothetical protein
MNSGLNLTEFLSVQPWLLPVTEETYQHLLSSSYQFYTILCDSFCRILYQDQYCEIAIPSSSPVQISSIAPVSPLLPENPQANSEFKFHIPREGKQFDIPIELLIAISPPSAPCNSSNHSPSLFLKINHELYLTNHTAIQELTFPKQQPSSAPAIDQLYLLLKWSTCSFYLYILPDQQPSPQLPQQGIQYPAPIIYEKFSSAVISMNRILRCSLASYEKLKQQLQETFQQKNSRRLQQFREKHRTHLGESSSSVECSSTTIGGDISSSPSETVAESTSLRSSIDSLLTNSSHLFALDCIQSSLHHWMDTSTLSRHLLQPVLPSPLYHELLLSSHLPPHSLSQNLSSSQTSHHKKRSLPSPPMTPSQTLPSSLNSPPSKRPKVRPIDRNGIPSLCLLNLPKDITLADSATTHCPHPYLDSCLHSLSSSLLSIEESESLERTLYETLDSMEAKILNSYSSSFALSRVIPSPSPGGDPKPLNSLAKYCEELEKIFAMPYRTLIEDITTLRLLPRNDRRPLHPHPSAEYLRKKS